MGMDSSYTVLESFFPMLVFSGYQEGVYRKGVQKPEDESYSGACRQDFWHPDLGKGLGLGL
jgi:hypothetical protein